MGSNYLIKYLCETGKNTPFLGAISAGNPYDLLGLQNYYENKNFMHRFFFGMYHKIAVHKLKKKIWRYKKILRLENSKNFPTVL
jgi:predicted alpha/beta-fold hydrolase